ncbi:riboflavin synthase subunit alpha [Polynucleobacter sp. SHI8]|uniref:riboflavin synthase n=1 Tax=unclassified Polynucleobacter TaxID=2640945 RepID=UPI002492EC09|nr:MULTISPECIES: riboflavin synthase [unclassified Polynucleobacter]BDW10242.1 riboflavin synthase subunit alpha [Polynucleobacter sp. SHI2]BDW12688.1 riboflavin synthase subunit alpha [Polynucleobacter sp. SHI8]
MFTGIIASIGKITHVHPFGDGFRLSIDAGKLDLSDVILGDSIAIQGACMTVVELTPSSNSFAIDISAESISKTSGLSVPGPVNLEKALRFNDRLGGHLVSGHVDGIATVAEFYVVQSDADASQNSSSWHLSIDAPFSLAKYLAYKGSVVINGTSLTVNQVEDMNHEGQQFCRIHINLIPHTLENTTLQFLKVGDQINLEVDLIARYLERMLTVDPSMGKKQ